MKLADEISQIEVTARKLREFGLLVGGIFALLGAFFLWRGKAHAFYFLIPGGLLASAGLLFPVCLKSIYRGWMTLALLLGWVVSRVLLSILFFLVLTPIGMILRLGRKDLLQRSADPELPTYWSRRNPEEDQSRQKLEQQF